MHFFQTPFLTFLFWALCQSFSSGSLRSFAQWQPLVEDERVGGRERSGYYLPPPLFLGDFPLALTSAVCSPFASWFQLLQESYVIVLAPQQPWYLGCGNTLSPHPPSLLSRHPRMPHHAVLGFSASLYALQAITWFKLLLLSVLECPVTLINTAGNSEKDANVLFWVH